MPSVFGKALKVPDMPAESHSPAAESASLRRLEPRDALRAAEIASASPAAAQWQEGSFAKLESSGYRGWVLRLGEWLAGFVVARVAAGETEILNIGVDPGVRRRGYGMRLLGAALEECRREGASRIFLEVRESNAAAIALYERSGFRRTGRRVKYYFDPVEDAVCMALEFAGCDPRA